MTDDDHAGDDFPLDPGDERWFAAHGEIAGALSASKIDFGDRGEAETRRHVANLLALGVMSALGKAGLEVADVGWRRCLERIADGHDEPARWARQAMEDGE